MAATAGAAAGSAGGGCHRPRMSSTIRSSVGTPNTSNAVHQSGLGRGLHGDDQPPVAGAPRARGDRDRPVDRPQVAAQRQLAADRVVAQVVARELVAGREHRDRQGQVEAGPRLAHVGGRQVGREALERELERRS